MGSIVYEGKDLSATALQYLYEPKTAESDLRVL